jgi:site-specific DNA recombinase
VTLKFAVIYLRVSTQKQARDGTSLESQLEACRQFAREHGYHVIQEIQDGGRSGFYLERDGMDQVRDLVRDGKVQAVICYKIDRMNRELGDLLALDKEFARYGAQLHFVADQVERTDEGILFFQMRGAFAQYERAQIMERTRRGKDQRVRNGNVIVTPFDPFGYKGIAGEARLEIVESEAFWAKKIFEWFTVERISLREIGRRLDAAGVPTKRGGKCWHPSTAMSILTNPIYTGEWCWNKTRMVSSRPRKFVERPREEWICTPVPALVSKETYDLAQGLLTENKRMSSRNAKHGYLLRGMLICEICGYRLRGSYNSAKQKRAESLRAKGATESLKSLEELNFRQYLCSYNADSRKLRGCPVRSLRADLLEEAVWAEVVKQFGAAEVLEASAAECLQEFEGTEDPASRSIERASLDKKQAALDSAQARLLTLYIEEDTFDRTVLDARLSELKQRQAVLNKEKHRLDLQDQSTKSVKERQERIQLLANKLADMLEGATYEQRRAFLEIAGFRGVVSGTHVHLQNLRYTVSLPISLFNRSKRFRGHRKI